MKHSCPLSDLWEIKGFPYESFCINDHDEDGWLSAEVPGDVHTILMKHGIIGDPALGTGDSESAWVEDMVWVWRRPVVITREMLDADELRLRFDGLDTLCDVMFDGVKICSFENMFIEHIFSLNTEPGEHRLEIIFWPVKRRSRKEELPDGFWINYSTERAFVRKAGYMFGWDWTPRVVTSGIWRPAYLEWVSGPELGRLQGRTLYAQEGKEARIAVSCAVKGKGEVRISLFEGETEIASCRQKGNKETEMTVKAPRLWWCHDQGEPFLYTLKAVLLDENGTELDSQEISMGIRSIEMMHESPEGEGRYVTILNGRPVFLKGANWVPLSNRPSTCTHDQYDEYISLAKEAGMNTLSLWGGGIYEPDEFYSLCDQKGLLCWQYLMFACGEYPDWDKRFMDNVRDEVEKITDRLRSHCCIALWIGNVESEMLCEKIHLARPMYGKKLFEEILPEWMAELTPGSIYVPSSPWGKSPYNGMDDGDRHNWDVWFSDMPASSYSADNTTFCSEFGLHAAPSRTATSLFTGEKNPSTDLFLFKYMNRDQDISRLQYYFSEETGLPNNIEEYTRFSMMIQAEGLAAGAEHFRRRFPACGGALIWQLNDCCICQSWSLIDALSIPKQAYFEAKRFFEPVLVSLKADADNTEVWVTNQSPEDFRGDISVEAGSFLGDILFRESIYADVAAGESKRVFSFTLGGRFAPNVIIGNRKRLYYAAAMRDGAERPACRFFVKQKDILLPPTGIVVRWESEEKLTIRSGRFARQVRIDGDLSGISLSDNWFDILPGQEKSVTLKVLRGASIKERDLKIAALNSQTVRL